METITRSIENLISEKIEDLSYAAIRYSTNDTDVSFSQLPTAIIHPAKITSADGEWRWRIAFSCAVSAMQRCLNSSPEAISEIYASMRRDFLKLPKLLMSDNCIVDVPSIKITHIENKRQPQIEVTAKIELEIIVDYIEDEQSEGHL